MSDPDPRTVDLSVEVPGTPDQVWEAIATGPGISSWLHPTRVGEHVGGEFAFDMGAGFTDPGTVTAYDSPERFATEAGWSQGDGESTTLATEWIVSTRGDGTCVVRMVMSGFGDGESWDDEIEGLREGMAVALETLRLYLAHFAGRRPADVSAGVAVTPPQPAAWTTLLTSIGLAGASVGDRVTTANGVPHLAGVVEVLSPGRHRSDVVLLVDSPAPGVADLATFGEDTHAGVHLTFFGDVADAVADRERPLWSAWLASALRRKDVY